MNVWRDCSLIRPIEAGIGSKRKTRNSCWSGWKVILLLCTWIRSIISWFKSLTRRKQRNQQNPYRQQEKTQLKTTRTQTKIVQTTLRAAIHQARDTGPTRHNHPPQNPTSNPNKIPSTLHTTHPPPTAPLFPPTRNTPSSHKSCKTSTCQRYKKTTHRRTTTKRIYRSLLFIRIWRSILGR